MTNDDFDKILLNRLKTIQLTLGKKALEYASTEDRLHNFKKGAMKRGTIPEKILLDWYAKHDVSLDDMVNDLTLPEIPDRSKNIALWAEKIGDMINYLILLEALICERHNT